MFEEKKIDDAQNGGEKIDLRSEWHEVFMHKSDKMGFVHIGIWFEISLVYKMEIE